MPNKPKIGQYRHTPGPLMQPGPDGVLRAARVRRRFPFEGVVFLVFGLLGPLVCAGASLLFQATGTARFLPQRFSDLPLPPAPSLENVLFGAGLHEIVLACGLAGWLLWRALWRQQVPEDRQKAGMLAVLPQLAGRGLWLGPLFALAMLPVGAFGLYIRTAPANQPWMVRPFFALLAVPFTTVSALLTGTVPLVVVLLGLFLGVGTAVAVAYLWQQFPEEPDLRGQRR